MPMVSGTSCITICVGPAGRSHTVPLSQPNIPLAPSISLPNNSFTTHGFLSSAYHPQPYHRTSTNLNHNDADVERAARNIVKGPRNSKHGSIKFGKKPRRPPPPVAQAKKDEDVTDTDKLPPQPSRPPVALPRTLIGDQVKMVKKDTEVKDTDIISQERLRSRTELKLDLKPVYDNQDVIQEKVSAYQPVPDIVSMTQKGRTLSPVKEVAVHKPPFRIDRSKSPQAHVLASKHASENRNAKEKEVITKDKKKVALAANPSDHTEVMKIRETKTTKSQNPPVAPKGGPAKRTFKPQQNVGHPLHEELMNKFGNTSVSSGNVPRLRKVRTKEPKSVKELFGDCKFSITGHGKVQEYRNLEVNYEDANISASRHSKDIISSRDIPKPLEIEYPKEKQGRNVKSLRQENVTPVGKNLPPLSEEKISDLHKKGIPKSPKDSDFNTKKSQTPVEPPQRQKHKSKVKIPVEKDAIDRLGRMTPNTPADIVLGAHNAPVDLSAKHKSVGIVSHHESLRVPWKGPPADFKRGGQERKSYTKIVCVVNL